MMDYLLNREERHKQDQVERHESQKQGCVCAGSKI